MRLGAKQTSSSAEGSCRRYFSSAHGENHSGSRSTNLLQPRSGERMQPMPYGMGSRNGIESSPEGAKDPGPLRAHARQQRQLPPLPLAIYICESNLAQPTKLCLHVQQLVRRIFRLHGETNTVQKFPVQPLKIGRASCRERV